jgi:hypothetical protein
MAYYRIYLLSDDDRIQEAREAHCDTDHDAMVTAKGLAGDYPAVEIWKDGQRVGRFRADELPSR